MICKIEGCGKDTTGKSKYCREHRDIASKKFKEMLGKNAELKAKREVEFAELWRKACEAGKDSASKAKVQLVSVGGPAFPVCGFGWVQVTPGNSAFANWLKKNGYARKDSYAGGVCIWINDYNQSYDMKYAYATGMAEVFRNAGINAYAGSRLD